VSSVPLTAFCGFGWLVCRTQAGGGEVIDSSLRRGAATVIDTSRMLDRPGVRRKHPSTVTRTADIFTPIDLCPLGSNGSPGICPNKKARCTVGKLYSRLLGSATTVAASPARILCILYYHVHLAMQLFGSLLNTKCISYLLSAESPRRNHRDGGIPRPRRASTCRHRPQ
jgi:hypothetical protein